MNYKKDLPSKKVSSKRTRDWTERNQLTPTCLESGLNVRQNVRKLLIHLKACEAAKGDKTRNFLLSMWTKLKKKEQEQEVDSSDLVAKKGRPSHKQCQDTWSPVHTVSLQAYEEGQSTSKLHTDKRTDALRAVCRADCANLCESHAWKRRAITWYQP